MENRLAQSPVNHPLATSIIAAALIALVVTGSLLSQPWQKCASANQSITECLQSEFFMMFTPTKIQSAPQQPAIVSPNPLTTNITLLPQVHVPQFPDFVLPRPEPEVTLEGINSPDQEENKQQNIPNFVAYQMSAIFSQNKLPALLRASRVKPLRFVQLEEPQTHPFFFNKIIIQDGDNLWSIASQIYGAGRQYIKIFEANKDLISSPHRIFPGQVLALPVIVAHNNSVSE